MLSLIKIQKLCNLRENHLSLMEMISDKNNNLDKLYLCANNTYIKMPIPPSINIRAIPVSLLLVIASKVIPKTIRNIPSVIFSVFISKLMCLVWLIKNNKPIQHLDITLNRRSLKHVLYRFINLV